MTVDPAATPRDKGDNGGVTVDVSMGGGLTQFGAYLDTLLPGGVSSRRHWHDSGDEFLYVLDGTAKVIDDGADDLAPGDATCGRHGEPNAHQVTNRADAPCTYLIVGTRATSSITPITT